MFIKNWHDIGSYVCYFSKTSRFNGPSMIQGSRCSWKPSATSSSSTMGSKASTSYCHQKLTWHMLISFNSKTNAFKVDPGGSRCSQTPSATSSISTMASTASISYVHQNLTEHLFIYYFSRQIDLKWSQRNTGWSRCSWTTSATSSSSTMGNTIYVHQK